MGWGRIGCDEIGYDGIGWDRIGYTHGQLLLSSMILILNTWNGSFCRN